jgi:dTDP-4-dehydrorhamnose reductase
LTKVYVIRTSWLYSEYGKNFYKAILKNAVTKKILKVTDREIGCPTNATNLAKFILILAENDCSDYGFKHFTYGEVMTRYGFAKRILKENNLANNIKLQMVMNYRTFARRPRNSVLE